MPNRFTELVRALRAKIENVERLGTLVIPGLFVLGSISLAAIGWTYFFSAPDAFPDDSIVTVSDGKVLSEIADDLARDGVIRSPAVFVLWAKLSGEEKSYHAGRYYFAERLNVFQVSSRIANARTGMESVRITLTEGMAAFEMAELLALQLPEFSEDAFLEAATPYEGYLFPDTYFIEPGTPEVEIVERLRETFFTRLDEAAIDLGSRSFEDVVIMASLIEKEAQLDQDRYTISGILWNRIARNMPLQVDAVFGYIKKRSGYAPIGSDLDIDSPYNTYRNRGLPPGAIANPGLASIRAAAAPERTPYFYYLTDDDGVMRYARTFDEHKANRARYGI